MIKDNLQEIYETQILMENKEISIGSVKDQVEAIKLFKQYCEKEKLDCSDINKETVTFRKSINGSKWWYTTKDGEKTLSVLIKK